MNWIYIQGGRFFGEGQKQRRLSAYLCVESGFLEIFFGFAEEKKGVMKIPS